MTKKRKVVIFAVLVACTLFLLLPVFEKGSVNAEEQKQRTLPYVTTSNPLNQMVDGLTTFFGILNAKTTPEQNAYYPQNQNLIASLTQQQRESLGLSNPSYSVQRSDAGSSSYDYAQNNGGYAYANNASEDYYNNNYNSSASANYPNQTAQQQVKSQPQAKNNNIASAKVVDKYGSWTEVSNLQQTKPAVFIDGFHDKGTLRNADSFKAAESYKQTNAAKNNSVSSAEPAADATLLASASTGNVSKNNPYVGSANSGSLSSSTSSSGSYGGGFSSSSASLSKADRDSLPLNFIFNLSSLDNEITEKNTKYDENGKQISKEEVHQGNEEKQREQGRLAARKAAQALEEMLKNEAAEKEKLTFDKPNEYDNACEETCEQFQVNLKQMNDNRVKYVTGLLEGRFPELKGKSDKEKMAFVNNLKKEYLSRKDANFAKLKPAQQEQAIKNLNVENLLKQKIAYLLPNDSGTYWALVPQTKEGEVPPLAQLSPTIFAEVWDPGKRAEKPQPTEEEDIPPSPFAEHWVEMTDGELKSAFGSGSKDKKMRDIPLVVTYPGSETDINRKLDVPYSKIYVPQSTTDLSNPKNPNVEFVVDEIIFRIATFGEFFDGEMNNTYQNHFSPNKDNTQANVRGKGKTVVFASNKRNSSPGRSTVNLASGQTNGGGDSMYDRYKAHAYGGSATGYGMPYATKPTGITIPSGTLRNSGSNNGPGKTEQSKANSNTKNENKTTIVFSEIKIESMKMDNEKLSESAVPDSLRQSLNTVKLDKNITTSYTFAAKDK
ncbi:hypothetical protein Dip510_000243 [Elusimicrobium posterum]|uniref:hypothetical protein n=1 Tax=Elusimicrobium posterum TaxID=3116653 RepID=UPI003C74BCDC